MDKETFDSLDFLYQSELQAMDQQVSEKIQMEFGEQQVKENEIYLDQLRTVSTSPVYGTYQSKDEASKEVESVAEDKKAKLAEKISKRKTELERERDEHLNAIYEFAGASREQAVIDHNRWLEQQRQFAPEIEIEKSKESDLSKDDLKGNFDKSSSEITKENLFDVVRRAMAEKNIEKEI